MNNIGDVLEDGISNCEFILAMGDDLMVVNAARVSYAKTSDHLNIEDERLIRYLARHGHWTPFSQPQIQFRFKMPIFVAREWYRHTIGLTRNEVSRRYVNTPPEVHVPAFLRNKPELGQSKQGSTGIHKDSALYVTEMYRVVNRAVDLYNGLIENGVAPEQARIVLPMGMYTEFIETGSLAAYARICQQRIQPDAMRETRKYAEAVSEVMRILFPISWKELMA